MSKAVKHRFAVIEDGFEGDEFNKRPVVRILKPLIFNIKNNDRYSQKVIIAQDLETATAIIRERMSKYDSIQDVTIMCAEVYIQEA